MGADRAEITPRTFQQNTMLVQLGLIIGSTLIASGLIVPRLCGVPAPLQIFLLGLGTWIIIVIKSSVVRAIAHENGLEIQHGWRQESICWDSITHMYRLTTCYRGRHQQVLALSLKGLGKRAFIPLAFDNADGFVDLVARIIAHVRDARPSTPSTHLLSSAELVATVSTPSRLPGLENSDRIMRMRVLP